MVRLGLKTGRQGLNFAAARLTLKCCIVQAALAAENLSPGHTNFKPQLHHRETLETNSALNYF